jgi:hypothetical protein
MCIPGWPGACDPPASVSQSASIVGAYTQPASLF